MTASGYSYDNTGNITYDATLRKFSYDGENKQVKVESTNSNQQVTGTLGEYWYDGDGKRVKKKGYNSTGDPLEHTIFVYDAAGKLIGEYSTEIAPVEVAKVAYLTNDHLGSPRINTDRGGNVTARHDYHPFGEEIGTLNGGSPGRAAYEAYNPDSVRKQFTGYERDHETGLDYAKARVFVSNVGRFSSPDPAKMTSERIGDPQHWNLYVYGRNSPLVLVDATAWKLHHPLEPEQMSFAGKIARVSNVMFYHGGDELYQLEAVPGIWHEACLSDEEAGNG